MNKIASVKNKNLLFAYIMTCVLLIVVYVFGLTIQNHVYAESEVTQAYVADLSLPAGTIVSLDTGGAKKVVAANINNGERLLGILVDDQDSSIALDSNLGNVQVATSGKTSVLVSNMNGDIKIGDVLVLSMADGVAAKSVPGGYIIGVAAADFNAKTAGASSKDIQYSNGETRSVAFGVMPVTVSLAGTVAQEPAEQASDILGWLSTLVGKRVTSARFSLAGVVALIVLISCFSMIYGSISQTIGGVSRNPLASAHVYRALSEVMLMVVCVTLVGVALIYVVLKV